MAEPVNGNTTNDGANPAPTGSAFSPRWDVPFEGWTYLKYARFLAYHKNHPWIWKAFCNEAEKIIKKGAKHYSADALLHVVRFNFFMEGSIGEDFKINNDYSCGYARAFHRKHPQHEGFFELRETKEGT